MRVNYKAAKNKFLNKKKMAPIPVNPPSEEEEPAAKKKKTSGKRKRASSDDSDSSEGDDRRDRVAIMKKIIKSDATVQNADNVLSQLLFHEC